MESKVLRLSRLCVGELATLANKKNYEQNRDDSGCFTKRHPLSETNSDSITTGNSTPFSFSLANTRSSSSLSTFDLVDSTQINTPFDSTPSASPSKAPPVTLPDTASLGPDNSMATEPVKIFHGDKKDENPDNFFWSFFRRMGSATDDFKKKQFKYFLQADSVADKLFDKLQQDDKKDWDAIEAAFNKCWPKKIVGKKTKEEYEAEITGLCLKMENLGKKETIVGREVYAHIAWADNMEMVVKGAKLEETTTYIGQVCKELPKPIKEKVGTGHADWGEFLQAVRDVDTDHIKDELAAWKREQDEQEVLKKRIQQLEKLTNSPTALLRQQMTNFSISNGPQPQQQVTPTVNPFLTSTSGCSNLFQLIQPKTSNLRPTPMLADRAALLACLQKYPHYPDTEVGRQAHRAQQADWARTHRANAMVNKLTPYPLRPGTLLVGSGECFTCRLLGHMG